jgi:hypothetical protein
LRVANSRIAQALDDNFIAVLELPFLDSSGCIMV